MVPNEGTTVDTLTETDSGHDLASAACMEYLLFIYFLASHVNDSKKSLLNEIYKKC